MKKIITIITLLLSLSLVAACGLNNDINEEKKETQNINNDINDNKEISIVADYYVGELLKLDTNVVGADLTYTSNAWQSEIEKRDIVNVGQSMEKVASLKPDLIVTMNEGLVEQYEAIATTLCIPYGTYNPEELMLKLGQELNKEELAIKWINEFNANIDELNKIVSDKSKTITILDIFSSDGYLYGEHYGRAGYIIYNKLGLKGTEKAEEEYIRQPESYLLLSVESMPDYMGDMILLMKSKEMSDLEDKFTTSVVWESLKAVENEDVYYLHSEDFWFVDPYSLDLQVQILGDILNEK